MRSSTSALGGKCILRLTSEPATAAAGVPLGFLSVCVIETELNVQLKQAPFAHHRGQVGEVGYGPQRIFIKSWDAAWWNIKRVRLTLGFVASADRRAARHRVSRVAEGW